MTLNFTIATLNDIEAVVDIVNRAHRPQGGKGGWTNESHLVAGPRVETLHVQYLLGHADSRVLVAKVDDKIVATAYVTRDGSKAHIGMLAVSPEHQTKGYGSAMLKYAEETAMSQFKVAQVVMLMVSDRPELLSFFERRQYLFTQQTMPFPIDAGVGIPKSDSLELLLLAKTFPTNILEQYLAHG